MASKTVSVRLRAEDVELLDTYALSRGIKRGSAVREALRWAFGANSFEKSILEEDGAFMAKDHRARAERIRLAIRSAGD